MLYEQSGVLLLNLRPQSSVERGLHLPKSVNIIPPMKQSANFQQALDEDETSKYICAGVIAILRVG